MFNLTPFMLQQAKINNLALLLVSPLLVLLIYRYAPADTEIILEQLTEMGLPLPDSWKKIFSKDL